MFNEIFDVSNIKVSSERLTYDKNKSVVRIVSLTDIKNKNLYFKTNEFNNNALYLNNNFVNKANKVNIVINPGNKINEEYNISIIDSYNKLKRDIGNKLRYIMNIPAYNDSQKQAYYNIKFYVDSNKKASKILEYNGKISDIKYMYLNQILEKCKCSLLIQLKSLIITSTDIFLELVLVRIYPDNLELIDNKEILASIYNDINIKSINNINKIKEFNDIRINRQYQSKNDIKDQIKSILKS